MTTSKRFAVFDVDGTLIRWQMLHAIIDRLGRDKHLPPEAYLSILTARKAWKAREEDEGFRAYEAQLVEVIQRHIANITVEHFNSAVHATFEEYKDQTYRYTRDLLQNLKRKGYLLFAISGSPDEIVTLIAKHYGFDSCVGTEHIQKDGKFTGEIIVTVHDKPRLLNLLVAKHKVSFAGSIGVGDSEGDIGMLDMVETPIAFNPSKKLFRRASEQGWKVVIERKNMVYELESKAGQYRLAGTNA